MTTAEAALAQIQTERTQVLQQCQSLDAELAALETTGAELGLGAAELEERIRQLAREEAELQKRKAALQQEAQTMGTRRTEVAEAVRVNQQRRAECDQVLGQLWNRENQIRQQAAQAEQERQQAEFQAQAQQAALAEQQARAAQALAPPQPAVADNRRIEQRVTVAVDVGLETEHNFYMGLTENLSEGGLFFATYENLPIGTELTLTLRLPEASPIRTTGVVRWVREHSQFTEGLTPGVGIQMMDLDQVGQQAIHQFLAKRDPIFFDAD